jgi:hypothetical protein
MVSEDDLFFSHCQITAHEVRSVVVDKSLTLLKAKADATVPELLLSVISMVKGKSRKKINTIKKLSAKNNTARKSM